MSASLGSWFFSWYLQVSQLVHPAGFYVLAGWEPEGNTRITRKVVYLPDWKCIPIKKELLPMSNKVIFNYDELFISAGIDASDGFSWMSIALPNQQFVGKPYKILHNSMGSLTSAVSKIKEAEDLYSLESRILLESTGIYHYPLFCYLRDKGFNCPVINPIITKNSTNINIRKVHNDRSGSKKTVLVGLKPDLKVSLMLS